VTKESQLPPFVTSTRATLPESSKFCLVAERVRDDERFLGLARLGLDLHTVSG